MSRADEEARERMSTTPSRAELDAAMRGENFPVAMRVLPSRYRHHLNAVYAFARHVDDIGDEATGSRTLKLDRVASNIQRLYTGRRPHDPIVAALSETVEQYDISDRPWLRLIEANQIDQRVNRYESFEELLGYCTRSANPVGEIVLHIFGSATTQRIAWSNRICTALQLLEHWQDVVEDYRNGRVYLPAQDLRHFGVQEHQLEAAVATPKLRALMEFETARALAWLDSGRPLLPSLRGWARVGVSGYFFGGQAAASALRRSGYDPMSDALRPTKARMAAAWAASTVRRLS